MKYKRSKLVLCSLLALMMTGCTDYSYSKAVPNQNKPITLSEPDSRMVLSQQIVDVIATRAPVDSQLTVYMQDTVKPTPETKKTLQSAIQTAIEKVNSIQTKTEKYQVTSGMVSTQKSAVGLMKDISKSLSSMLDSLEDNDFKALKNAQTQYSNYLKQLQGIIV